MAKASDKQRPTPADAVREVEGAFEATAGGAKGIRMTRRRVHELAAASQP